MRFLQARTELGVDRRSVRRTNSGLTQVIADLTWECPVLSWKRLYRFLHEKLGLKKRHLRWFPHQLTRSMSASRVAISDQLLEILQHCQATDFVNFLTGPSRGFVWSIMIMVWCLDRVQRWGTRNTNDKSETEKCMISIIWSISGIPSLLALTKRIKYNSSYFCQHVIPDLHIQQHICSPSRKIMLKNGLLHLGKAAGHNSRLSSEKIDSPKAQRVPHPAYHSDKTRHQLTSSSLPLCKEPPRDICYSERRPNFCDPADFLWNSRSGTENLFTNWIRRVSWVMKKGGED
jgi:hypothetical protein